METKKEIRVRIIEARKTLTDKEQKIKSMQICDKVISHPWYTNAKEVYCYMNTPFEVQTELLIRDAWKKGKRVGIPKIQNHTMKFYYISHMQDVEKGKYNILEPTTKELANNPEALIVMPGVAFDKERNRIGYGGGYYDRYLKLHPCGQTIALSYEIQCVSHISAEAFDCRPEILVTEGRILPMINEDNVTVISE
ncbi:MAG: 5-formyltetrahydrofolate cyclo-ligase [Lachnospiraceae bacterium]